MLIDDIEKKLSLIKEKSLYRELKDKDLSVISSYDFTLNDYLGLSKLKIDKTTNNAFSATTSSRLVSGNHTIHIDLENKLADFLNNESCLLFSSGYLANLGVLSSLISRNDLVLIDKLAHASLIDGLVLSRANFKRFRHNDVEHLEELLLEAKDFIADGQNIFVVTESVFSMDGDLAPLREIEQLSKKYQATFILDEAHAFGVFGEGRGLSHSLGVKPDVILATMSKAFASYGGLCFSKQIIRDYLINTSRPFIFNTSLPGQVINESIINLAYIKKNPNLGSEVLEKARFFATNLKQAGFDVMKTESQIVPLLIGSSKKAIAFSEKLRSSNIYAVAMREPTVPANTARIRFSVNASFSFEELSSVVETIIDVSSSLQL